MLMIAEDFLLAGQIFRSFRCLVKISLNNIVLINSNGHFYLARRPLKQYTANFIAKLDRKNILQMLMPEAVSEFKLISVCKDLKNIRSLCRVKFG